MSDDKTQDPVNQPTVQMRDHMGLLRLGILKNLEWFDDPRRFLFSQARYKFVAKMLGGRRGVLEVGCGDAFNAPIVLQEVADLTVTDYDPLFIKDARERATERWPYRAVVHNFLEGPLMEQFSAVYSLDVLEHINAADEVRWMNNICCCLDENAIGIFGMPSLESQQYASPGSKAGHVNCKTSPDFRELIENYFDNVLMFFMNDEVLHTGYHKMAHYIIAVGCGLHKFKKKSKNT
jgi:hypothetical protein